VAIHRSAMVSLMRGSWRQNLEASDNVALPRSATGELACLGGSGHAQQDLEQQQPALEIHGNEEVLLGVFAAVLPNLRGKLGMGEQVTDLVGASLHRVHENPGELVNDLTGNAADSAGHHRLLLP